MILLPFSNYANAQVPNYVGVAAGDQYTWRAKVNFGNVEDLLTNARAVLIDWKANLPSLDLDGLESLTIEEIYEEMAVTYLSNLLPPGWEGLNITDLIEETIEEYVEQFNATFLSGMIPSNWLSLNFSDFYDLAVDGINTTLLSTGWNDNPLPELYMLTINELNSTILYGLVPAGWEAMTLKDLIESLLMSNFPVMGESFIVQIMIDTMLSLGIPSDMLDDTISELIDELMAMLPTEITSLNATALFEQMFFGINQSMPGIESETMGDVIEILGEAVNSTMPSGYGELNMSSLLELIIENELYGMIYPPEMAGKTVAELLDMAYTQGIDGLETLIPEWVSMYASFQGMGMVSYEVGLRVSINSIGTEIEASPGGPKGVPISMNYSITMDFEEWIDLSTFIGLPGDFSPLTILFGVTMFLSGPLTLPPYIVDPSTYTLAQTALADQAAFTGTLIVANNYDWGSIQTDMIMSTSGNADAIEMSSEWNKDGVLKSANIETDGKVVAEIKLVGGGGEIPGYETMIILGFTSLALIAIIYNLKRKNKIIN